MGTVRVPSSKPLAGQSAAIVNVEWRGSGGALIAYESHTVASAGSPQDSTLAFSLTSGAAPSGTASARLLIGVLQGPGDPQRDAIFDQLRFEKQTVPGIEAIQWNDFPGGRSLDVRRIETRRVKGTGYYGHGTLAGFRAIAADAVWGGRHLSAALHRTISYRGGDGLVTAPRSRTSIPLG
jgi:hypothetical protein